MKMQFSKQNNIYLDPKSENGWLLITMMLILPLVLIAIAFVVDFGRSYILKEEIRQAADGALVATGKVYLEREDLKDGKDNSISPPLLSPTADKLEVEKLLKENFTYMLLLRGLSTSTSPTSESSLLPSSTYKFIPNLGSDGLPDGTHNMTINAQYRRNTLLGTVFTLIPKGKKFESVIVSAKSTYKVAPKSKIILGVILDVSGSVDDDEFLDLKVALVAAINKLSEGNYIILNIFNKTWDPATNNIVPPTKIVSEVIGSSGNEATKNDLIATVNDYPKPISEDGTYMQGGIYRIRKEIVNFINSNPNLENWEEYRKAIFIISDGWANKRSNKIDNSNPYNPPANYILSPTPLPSSTLETYPSSWKINVNPLTIFEADQARKSGIFVVTICNESCNDGDPTGRHNTSTMKRLANVTLNATEIDNLHWQIDTNDTYYVPYLVNGSQKIRDPNPFTLPKEITEADLYSSVSDAELPARLEKIIGKFDVKGNELVE